MRKKNHIKEMLQNGQTVRSIWAETGNSAIVEAAVHAGWPVILIDNEHGTASLETTIHMVRAIESAGGHAIVRIPWNDRVYLKKILDLGIQSIMIPMICDKAEAESAVAACRYPPQGYRGYAAPMVRASQYGANPEYAKEANDDLLLIAQIEHVDAIPNISEIADVDGIDLLFIGPHDLAGSMGKLECLKDKDVRDAIVEIEDRIVNSGALMGTLPQPGVSLAQLQERGHRLIIGPADIGIFMDSASRLAREWDDSLMTYTNVQ